MVKYVISDEEAGEITILTTRDTKSAWVPGRGVMGIDVGVFKTRNNTWLSSSLQNQRRSFFSFRLIFLCLVRSFSGTMHPVCEIYMK